MVERDGFRRQLDADGIPRPAARLPRPGPAPVQSTAHHLPGRAGLANRYRAAGRADRADGGTRACWSSSDRGFGGTRNRAGPRTGRRGPKPPALAHGADHGAGPRLPGRFKPESMLCAGHCALCAVWQSLTVILTCALACAKLSASWRPPPRAARRAGPRAGRVRRS